MFTSVRRLEEGKPFKGFEVFVKASISVERGSHPAPLFITSRRLDGGMKVDVLQRQYWICEIF